jgi:hypothetical protein
MAENIQHEKPPPGFHLTELEIEQIHQENAHRDTHDYTGGAVILFTKQQALALVHEKIDRGEVDELSVPSFPPPHIRERYLADASGVHTPMPSPTGMDCPTESARASPSASVYKTSPSLADMHDTGDFLSMSPSMSDSNSNSELDTELRDGTRVTPPSSPAPAPKPMGCMKWLAAWGPPDRDPSDMWPGKSYTVNKNTDTDKAAVNPQKYFHPNFLANGACYVTYHHTEFCTWGRQRLADHSPLHRVQIQYYASIGAIQFIKEYGKNYITYKADGSPRRVPQPTTDLASKHQRSSKFRYKPRCLPPTPRKLSDAEKITPKMWLRFRRHYETYRTE